MTDTVSETTLTPKRNYKSSIFEMIYNRNKRELLDLYNALNGTDYNNPEDLEITTLENAIYLGIHNDVSFLLDSRLMLYEHQSTYSPNLPVRLLHYISDVYSKLTKDKNIYGTKRVMLPTPRFFIFYNGETQMPDYLELKLSDSFIIAEDTPALELKAVMLNINKGHNQELLNACKTLHDYAEYTDRVRRYAKTMELADAVERAITECIKEGVLADFLEQNRREAMAMSIYEYDHEKHMRMEWNDGHEAGLEAGREEGLKDGLEAGRKEGLKDGLKKGLKEGLKEGAITFLQFCKNNCLNQFVALNGLIKEYQFSENDALELLKKYW